MNMKRIVAAVSALSLTACVYSCGSNATNSNSEKATESTTTAEITTTEEITTEAETKEAPDDKNDP